MAASSERSGEQCCPRFCSKTSANESAPSSNAFVAVLGSDLLLLLVVVVVVVVGVIAVVIVAQWRGFGPVAAAAEGEETAQR